MRIYDSVLDLIGETPLVRLNKIFSGAPCRVYAKLEGTNLTGSMKARSALSMIRRAESRGQLRTGMTIIESTSGNLGYAVAAIASALGYSVILVVDPKTDAQKRNVLKAYGAKLVVVSESDPTGAYQGKRREMVQRLLREVPNSWSLNQYENPDNPLAHYEATGPELLGALDDGISLLVGTLGTCGHLTGTARYLKQHQRGVAVLAVEPKGSVISGGDFHPYAVQGPGMAFTPTHFDGSVIDEVMKISDAEAFHFAARLSREESLLSGGSSGLVAAAAHRALKGSSWTGNVVLLLPDDGFRYAGVLTWADHEAPNPAWTAETTYRRTRRLAVGE